MDLSVVDVVVFVAFSATVVSVGMLKSRRERDSESYFLAGRGLTWWLIGISLIAANISTEQFVGMIGQAADYQGLAPASYDWIAAIGLVLIAFFLLPFFLRAGIYTMPEFLEHRYSHRARLLMAVATLPVLVLLVGCVTYSGALTLRTAFDGRLLLGVLPIDLYSGSWLIGLMAGAYVASGGLRACAWADLIQGTALIVGGLLIAWFAFAQLADAPLAALTPAGEFPEGLAESAGALSRFAALNESKLHMALPPTDPNLPWTALAIGLWIPNFYYWGLNQYITQRTLGSASLAQGQGGVVLAAGIQVILPLALIVPGMLAFNLYASELAAAAAPDNEKALARLAEVRNSPPEEALELFVFDARWEALHPEAADEMRARNETVRAASAAARFSEASLPKHHLLSHKFDAAFGLLLKRVLPGGLGLQGFVLAAILGAVVSSLAAMLNAAATIFTMDIFNRYLVRRASQAALVGMGRLSVGLFVLAACLIAPRLGDPAISSSIFRIIQESQGFISPGVLAVFAFGLVVRRAPRSAGVAGLALNPILYGAIGWLWPGIPFLDRMAICFGIVIAFLGVLTALSPLPEPVTFPRKATIDLTPSRTAAWFGAVIVAVTLALYVIFW
ncbi:MAG: sodium:solute symporter family transporter [Planctomycetota bacterium]